MIGWIPQVFRVIGQLYDKATVTMCCRWYVIYA
jgi:hypothetical protein